MRSTLRSLKARRGQNEKGFTLIELLVVVVIIGILIAIAIPLYLNYQKSSHDKATASDVRNAIVTMEQCFSDNGNKYPTGAALTASGPLVGCDSTFEISDGTTLTITSSSDSPTYKIVGTTSSGHTDKQWTYDSSVGGSVEEGDAPSA